MVKLDGNLMTPDLPTMGDRARRIEALGYDGIVTAEAQHNPFLPLALAVGTTERLELATGIAVAFARNPMDLAHIGHDLQNARRRQPGPR